jgi:hypothetical protein
MGRSRRSALRSFPRGRYSHLHGVLLPVIDERDVIALTLDTVHGHARPALLTDHLRSGDMIHGLPIQIVQLERRPILEEARRESQPVDHQLAVYAGDIHRAAHLDHRWDLDLPVVRIDLVIAVGGEGRADAQQTKSRVPIILLYSEHQIM